MRIGIDIDDTICATKTALKENLKGVNSVLGNIKTLTKDERVKLYYDTLSNNIHSIALIKNAKDVINKLKDMGHTIYIITARNNYNGTDIIDMTLRYLSDNEIYYDEIIFDAKTKKEDCLKNNIDIMIDDNYENCVCVKRAGIKVLYYNNNNIATDEFTCVYNWLEIYEYFKEGLWKKQ